MIGSVLRRIKKKPAKAKTNGIDLRGNQDLEANPALVVIFAIIFFLIAYYFIQKFENVRPLTRDERI